MVVFRLHRRGVALLGCLATLLAASSFAAGWLLGLRPRLARAEGPVVEVAAPSGAPAPAVSSGGPAAAGDPAAPAGPSASGATDGGPAVPPGPASGPATPAAVPGSAAAAPTPPGSPPGGAPAQPAGAGQGLLPPTVFSVQLALAAFEEEAKASAEALAQQGFEPLVLAASDGEGGGVYRVVVGCYATREEATAAAAALSEELDRRALVVEARLPKPQPPG